MARSTTGAAAGRTGTGPKAFYTPAEVGRLLMVSPVTVRLWARRGDLPAVQTPGGHRRFLREDVERFARDNNMGACLGAGQALRLLIVDGDATAREALAAQLASRDGSLEVDTAADGFQAGQKLVRFEPDVVVVDLDLAGRTGLDICRSIRSDPATRHVRLVAMGALLADDGRSAAFDAGIEACLERPVDPVQLDAVLRPARAAPAARRRGPVPREGA